MNDVFDFLKPDSQSNLLPYDGEVLYYGKILTSGEADEYYKALLNKVSWRHDEAVVFGRRIETARKVAWYGDAGYSYSYSGMTKEALPWIGPLEVLRGQVERISDTRYNSCLVNLYHSGEEGVGWHSDDEKTLARDGAIASVTFGAERKFSFKHKQTKETVSLVLEHGSLLIMRGATQRHWVHCIPKTKRVTEPRINLTFRSIVATKR